MRSKLGKHLVYREFRMPQLDVTFYCCSFFKRLAKQEAGDPFVSLAIEDNRASLKLCSTTDGGKSGQFFLIS